MTIAYDHAVDALSIELMERPVARTERVTDTLALDRDAAGAVIGIEILPAHAQGLTPLRVTIQHVLALPPAP